MFLNVPISIVICINENSTKSKILPQIKNLTCYTIDCTTDWKFKQKKLIYNNNQCIESCNINSEYKYEYNGKCYDNCEKGYLYDENNNKLNKCKCELEECLLCPNFAFSKGLCTKCNATFYQKEIDKENLGEYIKCYQELEGYYLEDN